MAFNNLGPFHLYPVIFILIIVVPLLHFWSLQPQALMETQAAETEAGKREVDITVKTTHQCQIYRT